MNIKMSKEKLKNRAVKRFWSSVDKNGLVMPHMDTSCWIWIKGTNVYGYPIFNFNYKQYRSSHFAYELENNVYLSSGEQLNHICDNKVCVRPFHLYIGTQQENIQDRNNRGRQAKGSNHGKAVLTENRVRNIRKLYSDGHRQIDIAQTLELPRYLVWQIVHNKTWIGIV